MSRLVKFDHIAVAEDMIIFVQSYKDDYLIVLSDHTMIEGTKLYSPLTYQAIYNYINRLPVGHRLGRFGATVAIDISKIACLIISNTIITIKLIGGGKICIDNPSTYQDFKDYFDNLPHAYQVNTQPSQQPSQAKPSIHQSQPSQPEGLQITPDDLTEWLESKQGYMPIRQDDLPRPTKVDEDNSLIIN